MQTSRYANPITSLEGHSSTIFSIAFHPSGEQVASGSYDNAVKNWDLKSKQCIETFKGHGLKDTSNDKGVLSVAYSLSGAQLASGAFDNTVKIWSLYPSISWLRKKFLGSCQSTLGILDYHRDNYVRSVAYCPDGTTLAVHNLCYISLFDTLTFKDKSSIRCGYRPKAYGPLVCAPSGTQMASGGKQCIQIFDSRVTKVCTTLSESSYVWGVSYLATETSLASGSDEGNLAVWDLRATKKVVQLAGHSNSITSISYSSKRDLFASASKDKQIKLWDTSLKCQAAINTEFEIFSVAFSPSGAHLASGGGDKKVNIWDVSALADSASRSFTSYTGSLTTGSAAAAAAAAAVDLLPVASSSSASTSAKPRLEELEVFNPKQLIYRVKLLYEEERFVESIELCKQVAESGNAEAQFMLAMAYSQGVGVEVNPYEAERWYYAASQQNHPEADFQRALSLLSHCITEETISNAREFFTALKCLKRAQIVGSEKTRLLAVEMQVKCLDLLRMVDWSLVTDPDLLADLISELEIK